MIDLPSNALHIFDDTGVLVDINEEDAVDINDVFLRRQSVLLSSFHFFSALAAAVMATAVAVIHLLGRQILGHPQLERLLRSS